MLPDWLPDHVRDFPDQVLDLGHDHYATFTSWAPDRDLNPQYDGMPDVERWGLIVYHLRSDGTPCHSGITFRGPVQEKLTQDRAMWEVHSLDPLHIEPSLLCRWPLDGSGTCDDHGWIREGRWVRA